MTERLSVTIFVYFHYEFWLIPADSVSFSCGLNPLDFKSRNETNNMDAAFKFRKFEPVRDRLKLCAQLAFSVKILHQLPNVCQGTGSSTVTMGLFRLVRAIQVASDACSLQAGEVVSNNLLHKHGLPCLTERERERERERVHFLAGNFWWTSSTRSSRAALHNLDNHKCDASSLHKCVAVRQHLRFLFVCAKVQRFLSAS